MESKELNKHISDLEDELIRELLEPNVCKVLTDREKQKQNEDSKQKRLLDFMQDEADAESYKRMKLERKHSNFKFEMGLLAVFGVLPMLTVAGFQFGVITFALYGIWKFLTRGCD